MSTSVFPSSALSQDHGLERLPELAFNLWWSWNPVARQLFAAIDPTLWRLTHHNPIQQLQEIKSEQWAKLAKNTAILRQYEETLRAFDEYMAATDHWFDSRYPHLTHSPVAYFSAEFGIHNSLPIYSGGLGILAGDHLKEASDLGVPLVGIGFMYAQAYFRQVIMPDGWQQAMYEPFNRKAAPIQPALGPDGTQCRIQVELGSRTVFCLIWQIQVGRVRLYLLDTDLAENTPDDRTLSARLYGGDVTVRLCQEILLGIGGVRALRVLDLQPRVWHINEGHAAFSTVERMRELVQSGTPFEQAMESVRQSSVFTTHTPVAAGHDIFSTSLINQHFAGYWDQLRLSRDNFMALGRHPELSEETFHMTALAIRLAGSVNGVSLEHGQVSRRMWQCLWPHHPEDRVPITHVTNGIHIPTWVAPEMNQLYSKYLGPHWIEESDDFALWNRVLEIPDRELWEVRQILKHKLLNLIRRRIQRGWREERLEAIQTLAGGALLEPDALTIGFGRRFATYKRATLLFRQPDRLRHLLHNPWRPVQFVFAGKAHPADEPGRRLIQEVYHFCQKAQIGGHIAFLEDYDMHVAKFLVQGVDMWLNNPRPPMEASGTSGQKAALNGVPNLSVLDGWWKEAYNGHNGWALPPAPENLDEATQDEYDTEALYRILEQEVIPLYYSRDLDGLPHGWLTILKNAIRSNAPMFNTKRMVKEYINQFYANMKDDHPW